MGWGDLGNVNIDNAIYNVNYKGGFSEVENNQIKNLKHFTKLHSNFSKLGHEDAWNKFNKLDQDTKDGLRYLYGTDNEYMVAPTTGFESLWSGTLDVLQDFNPLSMGFKALGWWNKAVTTVTDVASMAIDNGANVFDSATWSKAYSDDPLFNEDLIKGLTKRHGKEATFIAQQLLSGKNAGEILSARGDLNEDFLAAFDAMLNDPKWADTVLEDYKQAQSSIGRIVARGILGKRDGSNDTAFTLLSGFTDAAASILTDPLTYLTFGAGKGVSFMGQALTVQAKANKLAKAGNVSGLFKLPEVSKKWDEIGSLISDVKNARKVGNDVAAAEAVSKLKRFHPEHSTDEEIEMFIKGFTEKIGIADANGKVKFKEIQISVTSARSAEKYFSMHENASRLLRGRTSDTTYFRDSVAIAKGNRGVTAAIRDKWYKFGSSGIDDVAEKQTTINSIKDELLKTGTDIASMQNIAKPALKAQLQNQSNRLKTVTRMLSQSPGDNAIAFMDSSRVSVGDTLSTLKNVLYQFMDRDIADGLGEAYLRMKPDERLTFIRGTYISLLESLGVDKIPAGKQLINEIIETRFGGGQRSLMAALKLEPRLGFNIHEAALRLDGAYHSTQLTTTVNNLPWNRIAETVHDAAFLTAGKSQGKTGVSAAAATVGGALNSSLSGKLTNFWSFFTLNPRLGMRTTIDEAFMFYLTAPMEAMLMVRRGKAAGRAITAATGADAAIGVVSKGFRAAVRKFMPDRLSGKMDTFDYLNAIPAERRQEIYANVVMSQGADAGLEVIGKSYLMALGIEAAATQKKIGVESFEDVVDLVVNGMTDLGSAESSVARATGLNGSIDNALRVELASPTALTGLANDLKIKYGDFQVISPKDFADFEKSVIQYNAFFTRFLASKAGSLHLGEIFMKHQGLPTNGHFTRAVDEVMTYFEADLKNGNRAVFDFIESRASTIKLKSQYNMEDPLEIARVQVQTALMDMNQVFHGGSNKYNAELFDTLQSGFLKYKTDTFINAGKEVPNDAWSRYIRNFTHDEYSAAVKPEFLFNEDFATNVAKIGDISTGYAAAYKQFENNTWEAMDRMVTGFIRQPAVMAYYLANRKAYRKFEIAKADELIANGIPRSEALEMSKTLFTNIASKDAMHQVLKFVDNPHIRTNIVASVRNVSRFARATEDFWRRIYRMKDITPQAMYRARLLHNGLANTGILEKDEHGEEYFVIPVDSIIHSGIDPVLRALSGGDTGFTQPLFNRWTVKMTAVNPSFQEDAGIPFLSGPAASVSVLALKSIAGTIGGETGRKAGDAVGQILIGDYNTNLTLKSAVVPSMINRIWSILDTNEQESANHSATLSAIAYNQASGVIHPGQLPTATPKERADYLKQVRISGHNLVAIRSLIGMLLPFSMTPEDNVNVAEHLKDVGTMSLNQEYSSILQSVRTRYGAEVSDPYELAAALFIGQHPSKLIYTVSKNGTGTLAYLQRTKQTKDWLLGNKEFIDAYGEAAYFFAPQHGDVDLSMYQYMEAAGLYEDVDVEEYLTRVQTAADKREYYAIGKRLEQKLAGIVDYDSRKLQIDLAEQQKQMLKMKNPLLESALTPDGGFGVEDEKVVAQNLMSIVDDPTAPLDPGLRQRLKAVLTVFNRGYNYVSNPNMSYVNEGSVYKRQMRDRTVQDLLALTKADPILRQIFNNVLEPILGFHSRDSITASSVTGPQAQG